MKRRSWLFWLGVGAPTALILIGAALVPAFISYNRAYNNAFYRCDALVIAADPARSEFREEWLPPRFECVLYDEDGAVIRRERV